VTRLFGRTLRAYVLSIVLLGSIVPLAIVGAWLTRGGVRSGETLLEQQLSASLERVLVDMEHRWDLRRGDLLMLADNAVARRIVTMNASTADSTFLAQAAATIDKSIVSFTYVDREGRRRWSSPVSVSPRDSVPGGRANAGGPTIDLAFPIRDSTGSPIGRVDARMRVAGILPIDSTKIGVSGSRLAARDSSGTVLVPLDDSLPFPREGIQRLRGARWLAVVRRAPDSPIEVALTAATGPYVAPFEHAGTVGLVSLLIVAAGALLVSVVMTTRLARSVDRLAVAADAVSRGDLTSEVPASGTVELERLARAFNVMTESLRRLVAELSQRRALAAVGEFAASLSHEIRNALTPVEVDLERVQERVADDARTVALVTRARSQVQRLESAVTGALAIARSGRVVQADIDLRSVLAAAIDGSQSAFQASGSRVELLSEDSPLRVRGDADALRHLFVNVLLNAGQALQPGGLARMNSHIVAGRVTVSVVDDGPGIADEVLERATQPFFSTRSGGTGLGLPIAQQIATAHGGTLEIGRAQGRGTIVTVTLPAV